MENETNDGELTSSMGNIFGTPPAKDEKSDSNDSTPTSSTDANTSASASKIVTEDPISSTSSDTAGLNVCKNKKELNERESKMRRDQLDSSSALLVSANALSDLLYMNITDVSHEKITEDVEDIVQDLENLLGESSSFSTDYKNNEEVKFTESSSAASKIEEKAVTDPFTGDAEIDTVEKVEVVAKADETADAALEPEILATVEKEEPTPETETVDKIPQILATVEKEELTTATDTVDKIPEILETVEKKELATETETVDKIPEILETVEKKELTAATETVVKIPEILETFEMEEAVANSETADGMPEILETVGKEELVSKTETPDRMPEPEILETVANKELIAETETVDKTPEALETVENKELMAEMPEKLETVAPTELITGDEKCSELPEKVIEEDTRENVIQEKIDEETEKQEMNITPVQKLDDFLTQSENVQTVLQESTEPHEETAPDQIIETVKEKQDVECPETEGNLQEKPENSSSQDCLHNLIAVSEEVTEVLQENQDKEFTKVCESIESKHSDYENNEEMETETAVVTEEATQIEILSKKGKDKDETENINPDISKDEPKNNTELSETSDNANKSDGAAEYVRAEEVCVKEVIFEDGAIPEDVNLKRNIQIGINKNEKKSAKSEEVDAVKPSHSENQKIETSAIEVKELPHEDPLLVEGKEPKAVKTIAYICGGDEEKSEGNSENHPETSEQNLTVADLSDSSKFEIIQEDNLEQQTIVPDESVIKPEESQEIKTAEQEPQSPPEKLSEVVETPPQQPMKLPETISSGSEVFEELQKSKESQEVLDEKLRSPVEENTGLESEKLKDEIKTTIKSQEIEYHDESPLQEIPITSDVLEVKSNEMVAESTLENCNSSAEEPREHVSEDIVKDDSVLRADQREDLQPESKPDMEQRDEKESIEQDEESSKPISEKLDENEPSKTEEKQELSCETDHAPVLEEKNSTNLTLPESETETTPENEDLAAVDDLSTDVEKSESNSKEAEDLGKEVVESNVVSVSVPVPRKATHEKVEKSEKVKQVHFEEQEERSSSGSEDSSKQEVPELKSCKKTRLMKSPEPTPESDEKEEQKGSLKMTITKQSDSRHSIFKVSSPPEVASLDHAESDHDNSELVVPKLILKSVSDQDHPKGASKMNKSVPANTQRSGSPRITIKTIVKPEILSPLKITISKGKSEEATHKQKHSPKASKSKAESETTHHHSPRRSLKLKQLEQEHACSPKITIKPIPKPSDFALETTSVQHLEKSSPKITFKPVVDPNESENVHDDSVKERIVLKINKSKKREMTEKAEDERPEKLAKIKLKFGKAGEHPHIVQPEASVEESNKRVLESDVQDHEKSKRIRLESGVSSETQSRLKDLLNSKGIVAASSQCSQEVNTPAQAELIKVSSDIGTDTDTATGSTFNNPAPAIPTYDSSSEAVKPAIQQAPVPPPGPRKRGRPRKVPLVIREEFKDDQQAQAQPQPKIDPQPKAERPVYESTRPKRSCRGQSARVTLGIKPRKPRGSGRGRGSRGGGNSLAVTMKPGKEPKQSSAKLKRLKESVSALVEEAKLTASAARKKSLAEAVKISAQSQQQPAPEPESAEGKIEEAPPEVAAEIEPAPAVAVGVEPGTPAAYGGTGTAQAAIVSSTPVSTASNESSSGIQDIVMFEEETRMSADISSRAQTPEKKILPCDMVEESQSSILSTATTESAKLRRQSRLEVHQEPEGSVISADQLAEYSWGNMGPFMLQEQVAQFLGIKSFKRKYPNIQRRMVDMQERDFIREMGLASEAMCDLGLTAVNSADILDIMYSDFQDKYEEYCKHQRDRQAKELINKQKALSLAASLEKNKLDIMQQAMKSAMQWNVNFNKTRREQRRACMDLQTLTVHYPKGKMKPPPKDPVGPYPVAVVPGQFTDYYKEYTSTEINNLPLNSLCYEPIRKLNPEEMEVDSQSEDSGTESATSSSGSDSSDSESSDEDCKICKEQKATAVPSKKVSAGST